MAVELFITNIDFLIKLQAVFNLDNFILNFNATRISMQGEFFLKINKRADHNKAVQGEFFSQINKRACRSIRYSVLGIGNKIQSEN